MSQNIMRQHMDVKSWMTVKYNQSDKNPNKFTAIIVSVTLIIIVNDCSCDSPDPKNCS